MFFSMNGHDWRHTDNWLKGNPCGAEDNSGNWIGVICGPCVDGVRHVEVLSLEWNNLKGNITESIGELTELKVINFGTNSVEGEIPQALGNLKKLQALKLSYNRMEGKWPVGLLDAHDMEVIDVPYNDFVADVNLLFKNYPKLKKLNARGNRGFSGDLGAANSDIAKMTDLQDIDLHWNNIGGKVPKSLFSLPNIREITLSNNMISGHLPNKMNAPNLKVINIADNFVVGVIPRAIGNLQSLETLNLEHNIIKGSIPTTIGNLKNLKTLKLRSNTLTNEIPSSFWTLANLKEADLSNNEFGGELPATINGLDSIEILKLHACRLTGEIPETIGDLTSLKELSLFNNGLVGEMPKSIGMLTQLEKLFLRNNRLSGVIPEEFGQCRELQHLELQDNRFERLPESIGDLFNLRILMLHKNRFAQPMPSVLGYLEFLETLSLHGNEFTGESIPATYSNLRHLVDFTAHDNKLTRNPYPRMDNGMSNRPPHKLNPFCEDLRAANGSKTHSYFRTCGTRNDFYVDVLMQETRHRWVETHGENWEAAYGKCKSTKNYGQHYDFQRTSRFADMYEVADKSKFATYMKRMLVMKGNDFDFHPPTFRLPYDLDAWKEEDESDPEGWWLLKPSISCCGQNIRLVEGAHDPTFPEDTGNWILQRFVHPPMLYNNHKFVLRLFAIVTSFSPLRVYLHPDGDVFYTHAEYSLSDEARKKRGNFISDYFFTKKQANFYTTSSQLMADLKSQGIDTDQIYSDLQDVIVKALIVAEPSYRHQEQETIAHPESVYEVLGYDILLDKNHKPFVCEVNTTPNMGLEINRGNDAMVHEEDFELKLRLMRGVMEMAGIVEMQDDHPNHENAVKCESIVFDKLSSMGISANETVFCPEDDLEFKCLSERDISMLVEYECEYQRRGNFDPMFPGVDAEKYLDLWPIPRRENHLMIWWKNLRAPEPAPEYPTQWSTPVENKFRDPSIDWAKWKWTANTPGNRWNTDEEGQMPDPNEDRFILDDGDAFDDDEEPAYTGIPLHVQETENYDGEDYQFTDEELRKYAPEYFNEDGSMKTAAEMEAMENGGAVPGDDAQYEEYDGNFDDFGSDDFGGDDSEYASFDFGNAGPPGDFDGEFDPENADLEGQWVMYNEDEFDEDAYNADPEGFARQHLKKKGPSAFAGRAGGEGAGIKVDVGDLPKEHQE